VTSWCPRGCGRPSRRTILVKARQPPLCVECHLGGKAPRGGPGLPRVRVRRGAWPEVEHLYQRALADIRRRRRAQP
jgi:hypothetical protein